MVYPRFGTIREQHVGAPPALVDWRCLNARSEPVKSDFRPCGVETANNRKIAGCVEAGLLFLAPRFARRKHSFREPDPGLGEQIECMARLFDRVEVRVISKAKRRGASVRIRLDPDAVFQVRQPIEGELEGYRRAVVTQQVAGQLLVSPVAQATGAPILHPAPDLEARGPAQQQHVRRPGECEPPQHILPAHDY